MNKTKRHDKYAIYEYFFIWFEMITVNKRIMLLFINNLGLITGKGMFLAILRLLETTKIDHI